MKKQPSAEAGAEADFSHVNWAFLSRLTDNTANRWLKATEQLFLSLNGEENGTTQHFILLCPSFKCRGIHMELAALALSAWRVGGMSLGQVVACRLSSVGPMTIASNASD